MKRIIKHSLIFLTLAFSFGCDEWMDLIPPEGLIREEFWTTKEDVEAVLMGAYESFAVMDGKLFRYGELRADMIEADYNLGGSERNIMEGNIYPDNYLCNWQDFYKVIDYCNEVIVNAPEVQNVDNTFTDYQLQGYLSEAVFLRSLCYFYLVRIFKDVPYVIYPTISDETDVYVPKSNGDEILQQLIVDLEDIRRYATIDGFATLEQNKGRATKAAIDALLADISLWMFDYESVLEYVGRIEANDDYVLLPGGKWFQIFYPGNSLEGIFEFQFDTELNQNNSMFGITRYDSHNVDPSQKALELFAKKFARELVRGEDATIAKRGEEDFIIWKYIGRSNDGTTERTGSNQSSCNWIVYRLADVLLMKAEALSQLGRYPEALSIINEIRERADVPALQLANSASAYEDAILAERARELAFEGKRWFDLMRMGRRNNYARKNKLIEVIVQNVRSTQKRILAIKLNNPLGWYLPIHEEEIERNKALVQNPYYNF
ncbi:MAG: RagB/SusD family nutrient uptake outer membrane protein [bacterium]